MVQSQSYWALRGVVGAELKDDAPCNVREFRICKPINTENFRVTIILGVSMTIRLVSAEAGNQIDVYANGLKNIN
jgi:hypothetical protein